ncbi:uncharacterized protein [Miscanthus floridulus]|uniref:uncharacterized protein n=1 Tax=Miscanthus floridulus TaxID=154761 RepID=UPI0034597CBF
MATFCALPDVEVKGIAEEVAVAEQGTASWAIDLDESCAQVHLGRVGDDIEQKWYQDSSASNHMTGSKAAFSRLDGGVMESVRFGDCSKVEIRGRGTIIFRCRNGEHRTLMDVYYIPQLCSSIVSIEQLDKRGCEVLIESGILKIRDREWHLLMKVKCSRNRLYLLNLKVE